METPTPPMNLAVHMEQRNSIGTEVAVNSRGGFWFVFQIWDQLELSVCQCNDPIEKGRRGRCRRGRENRHNQQLKVRDKEGRTGALSYTSI